jgi:TonB-dependent SusC/RagA subfamily outer membrane receptor
MGIRNTIMTNIKRMNLNMFFAAVTVCLFATAGNAQMVDAFYTSNENVKTFFIEKDTELKNALEIVEDRYNIVFLYQSDMVEGTQVAGATDLSGNVENVLGKLLNGTGLKYTNLNPKTYGIYAKDENLQKSFIVEMQQNTISGTVVDAQSGESLPGVNILLQGTTTGTATNSDGYFELAVPSLDGTLVFTYIGYNRIEVPIEGQTEINIELQSQAVVGSELVVTAFGIARERAAVGYSVSEVEGNDLTKARTVNVVDNLSGRVAGVNATQMGGGAGSSSRILIRGAGSLDGDNQPLYIINGMPMSNNRRSQGAFESGASVTDKGDGIQHINPDDIESISVLKGGAAAALYGSQAANGVILITTKQGTQYHDGGIGVEFNSNFDVGFINRYPDLQTQYGQGQSGVRPQTQQEA